MRMELVKHETCLEYFQRRLREGWRCISLEGYNAVLLSPDGNIRREIDLRNDVETLRPNAAGDYTNIASQFPNSTFHFDKVYEVVCDDDTTYLYTTSATQEKDAFNLGASALTDETINGVTVFYVARSAVGEAAHFQPFLRLSAVETTGTEIDTTSTTYTLRSEALAKPGGGAWAVADLADLQVAIGIWSDAPTGYSPHITQVYVEVDHSAAGWSGKITGVTDPAAIMGVVVADIEKVKGVESA